MQQSPEFQLVNRDKNVLTYAATVKMPEILPHTEEGFDFFDQPPLSWMLDDPAVIPSDFFSESLKKDGFKAVIVALVSARNTDIPPQWFPKKKDQSKKQQHALNYITESYNQRFDFSHLNPVLVTIWQHLQSYSFLMQYLKENLTGNALFDTYGRFTNSASTRNKFVLTSYAAYKGSRVELGEDETHKGIFAYQILRKIAEE